MSLSKKRSVVLRVDLIFLRSSLEMNGGHDALTSLPPIVALEIILQLRSKRKNTIMTKINGCSQTTERQIRSSAQLNRHISKNLLLKGPYNLC